MQMHSSKRCAAHLIRPQYCKRHSLTVVLYISRVQLHGARDEMHDQLEHIESSLSLTDIEKPDTPLPNLAMDANDDLAEVLTVRRACTILAQLRYAKTNVRADVYAREGS